MIETQPYIATDVRRAVTSLGVAAALGVGWSRLYLDEHWIDDVVGGWIAGITVGASSVASMRALRRSHAASRADGRGEM